MEIGSSGACWYALHVKYRYEKITATVLHNKGYPEFLPLYRAKRQWSDRIADVELPLFPGYVFCHFDVNNRRVPVVTTPGVLRIVGIGPVPAPVDESEMGALQTMVDSGLSAEPWPYVRAGQSVRIAHGAMAGIEGILVEARKRHRLVLSVTLLQRSVAVEVDTAWVMPLTTLVTPCSRR
jgi:transcription antitermination factor NusG